jgi:hypothetical protein
VQDLGVELPWLVLSGGGVRKAQKIEVRPVVAGIADLPACESRLERERPAEGHHHVWVRCDRQAMVYHLGYEARNT